MTLSDALAHYIPLIDAELRLLLEPPNQSVAVHYEIMQYHMGWRDQALQPSAAPSGKRIRPLLCLLSCAAAGGEPLDALPAAAGLELLHNFSLLHDDIEDRSATRRHRPTAWSLWGVPIACNVGDGMFSLSHLSFFRLRERGVSESVVAAVLHRFVEMTLALTEGQYLDMSFEQRLDVSAAEYDAMIANKTGALLGVAPEIGALVGGASPEEAAWYRQFGAALGRAFQLQDDILGIWGDEKQTGKSTASDILTKKKTLPVLIAMNNPAAGAELRALYAGDAFDVDDAEKVLVLLDRAGAREATEEAIGDAMHTARNALRQVAGSGDLGSQRILLELLESLLSRNS